MYYEFLFRNVLLLGPGTIQFKCRFRFRPKVPIFIFGKHSASAESRTPLSVLLSVSAENETFTTGRPLARKLV